MRLTLLAALSLAMLVAGCGGFRESRLNPFNWFGRAEPAAAQPAMLSEAEDPRLLVAQITDLRIEPMMGGAIVNATGLPPRQGFWDAELVAREVDGNGVLVYDFRVFPPLDATEANTVRSRQITAGAFLTNRQLEDIRQIIVQGEANALTSRR